MPPVLATPIVSRIVAMGVGAAIVAALRSAKRARSSVVRDDTLDAVDEGMAFRSEKIGEAGDVPSRQTTVEARARRIVRLGRRGPGLEIDVAGLARGRVRVVPSE